MTVDKLESAQLQVVLPGTRGSFRRRVVDAMHGLIPAQGSFCFLGKDDVRAYGDATRLIDGFARPLSGGAPVGTLGGTGLRLSTAFGFDPVSVVAGPRRVYLSHELWPDAERVKLPYFAETRGDGMVHAMLAFLHEGGVLFGLAGLERRDVPFSEEDRALIESLAPFVVTGARAVLQYDELAREAAALRALGKVKGIVFVVDRDRRRVVWAADRENGIDWEEDVVPLEEQLVDAVEQSLLARQRGDAIPTPPRLRVGSLVAVAKVEEDPVFGGARCAAVRVEISQRAAPIEGLSKRERAIARLLVAGYSGVNVAAISGLSENTVRTYVRRLYGKLGVNNRADLVRKLVSPEAASQSGSPSSSSQLAAVDSSLAEGDDTLD